MHGKHQPERKMHEECTISTTVKKEEEEADK